MQGVWLPPDPIPAPAAEPVDLEGVSLAPLVILAAGAVLYLAALLTRALEALGIPVI